MKLIRSFVAPSFLREEEYPFTLDHDGGLVVNLEVIRESGVLDRQLTGVRRLRELKRKQGDRRLSSPSDVAS